MIKMNSPWQFGGNLGMNLGSNLVNARSEEINDRPWQMSNNPYRNNHPSWVTLRRGDDEDIFFWERFYELELIADRIRYGE